MTMVLNTCGTSLVVFILLFGCTQRPQVLPGHKAPLLMHDVYLDLVDSLSASDYDAALASLWELKEIGGVYRLHVGSRAETGDPRLDENYDLALHVEFLNVEDLKKYDQAPKHQEIRVRLKPLLAAPPRVFDYWTR